METDEYGSRPSYWELAAIVLAGAVHVLIELRSSETVATLYNVAIAGAFVTYVLWRIRGTPGVFRTWGLRADNFVPAARVQLYFVGVGSLVLLGYALVAQTVFLPYTFWLTAALYPIWGIAQQFALQNMIAKNLTSVFTKPLVLALTAATLFAMSHYPRLELVALTFVSGIAFTLMYRKIPNLWAVGIAHGLLGTLAYYLVLAEDPGVVILAFFVGGP